MKAKKEPYDPENPPCLQCGDEFIRLRGRGKHQIYCSQRCRIRAFTERRAEEIMKAKGWRPPSVSDRLESKNQGKDKD
jgi:hypothetical protein